MDKRHLARGLEQRGHTLLHDAIMRDGAARWEMIMRGLLALHRASVLRGWSQSAAEMLKAASSAAWMCERVNSSRVGA